MDQKRCDELNLRDLSYLSLPDGSHLKEGIFFRSAHLHKLTKKDVRFLESLNVGTVLDLRTPVERDKKPDYVLEGAEYLNLPLLEEAITGITHEKAVFGLNRPPHMPTLYRQLIDSPHAQKGLSRGLKTIFSFQGEGAILWHCTEGKDRGGLLTALFLASLGYDEETIFADYQRSNRRSEPKGRKYRRIVRLILWSKRLAHEVYCTMLADPMYLRCAFDEIKEKHESISSYLHKELDISQELIDGFAKRFLVRP